CDDGSANPALTCALRFWGALDGRIRSLSLPRNRGIAVATNTAIRMGVGDYVAFLDQDDVLAPNALAEVAGALEDNDADLLYTDEDRLDAKGSRIEPIFKPDWSPDLLLS